MRVCCVQEYSCARVLRCLLRAHVARLRAVLLALLDIFYYFTDDILPIEYFYYFTSHHQYKGYYFKLH